jgi:adenosylcobinamide-GDP ribazoletransferase
MCWAPAVGLAVGAVCAGVLVLASRFGRTGPLLAAVLAIAAGVALSRALHLDGLADFADGLGSRGPAAIIVAAVAARLAITVACRRGVPAARPGGLGALVAGSVHPLAAVALTVAALAAAASAGWIFAVALAVGLAVSATATALAARRLGGITGDVLGALAELAAAATLLVTALR